MQFRNTTDIPATITVRLNPGVKVSGVDINGNNVTKFEQPRLHTVHIPALATVEIEDGVWEKAWDTKSIVSEQVIEKQECAGFKKSDESTHHYISVAMKTGKTSVVFPIRERVKSGEFEIVKAPKIKLTSAEVIAELKSRGVSTELEGQELIDLYKLIVG